ncbi:MAG: hypothetical protein F9K18_00940 [Thermoanaerobaculia bacterium]|nr:MAG: hypothetical protein F9K18_00940 [Thermoanaerobaculia bacterium]
MAVLLLVAAAASLQLGCGMPGAIEAPHSALRPENVPEDLRSLLPLAERWGIGDDLDRNAVIQSSTAAEREELREAVALKGPAITAWLDSFESGADMTSEAAAFMYMQLAVEELPQ